MDSHRRLKNKILQSIKDLNLDLEGKIVLTEAATGAYSVTAIIAALAGAKVYAFAKSSQYGTVDEVFDSMQKLINEFGRLDIHLIDILSREIISKADIITNSGHLRPLDKEKLQYTKQEVVIPLMYEVWERRDADIDLEYCKKRSILIGATNEKHQNIDVFNYLGDMALKLIFDAGLCLYKNKFVLICNNDFGPYIAKALSKVCLKLGVIDKNENRRKYNSEVEWLSEFPSLDIPKTYYDTAAVIFTAYPFDRTWIGENTLIDTSKLRRKFLSPYILRYAGDVDTSALIKNRIRFYPEEVKSGHMGIIPSEIGYDPIIRLQTGGLKVGQALLEKNFYHNNELIGEII